MAIAVLAPLTLAAQPAVVQGQGPFTEDADDQHSTYSDDLAALLAEMADSIDAVDAQVQQLTVDRPAENAGIIHSMLAQLQLLTPVTAQQQVEPTTTALVHSEAAEPADPMSWLPLALVPDQTLPAPTQTLAILPALAQTTAETSAATQSLITTFPAGAAQELAAEQRQALWTGTQSLTTVLPPPEKAALAVGLTVHHASEVHSEPGARLQSAVLTEQAAQSQASNQHRLVSLLSQSATTAVVAEQATTSVQVSTLSAVNTASQLPVWQADPLPVQSQQWGQRLVQLLADKVDLQLGLAVNKAMIRLDPPSLGNIELSVQLDGERLTVQMHSSNAQLRDAMGQGLEQLRASLQQKLGADLQIELRLATENSSQQQQQKQQQQRGQTAELNFLAEPEPQQLSQAQAHSHNLVNQLV